MIIVRSIRVADGQHSQPHPVNGEWLTCSVHINQLFDHNNLRIWASNVQPASSVAGNPRFMDGRPMIHVPLPPILQGIMSTVSQKT